MEKEYNLQEQIIKVEMNKQDFSLRVQIDNQYIMDMIRDKNMGLEQVKAQLQLQEELQKQEEMPQIYCIVQMKDQIFQMIQG